MRLLKQKGGFTLIETIAAVAVLVVILLGFTMMVTASSNFNIRAKEFQNEFDNAKQNLSAQSVTGGTVTFTSTSGAQPITVTVNIKQNDMLTSFEVGS